MVDTAIKVSSDTAVQRILDRNRRCGRWLLGGQAQQFGENVPDNIPPPLDVVMMLLPGEHPGCYGFYPTHLSHNGFQLSSSSTQSMLGILSPSSSKP